MTKEENNMEEDIHASKRQQIEAKRQRKEKGKAQTSQQKNQ